MIFNSRFAAVVFHLTSHHPSWDITLTYGAFQSLTHHAFFKRFALTAGKFTTVYFGGANARAWINE
jgi:hypothetical protein